MECNHSLASRLAVALKELRLSQIQAATDAMVSLSTLQKALDGHDNLRTTTVQRLERWLERAERRVPRP